MNEKAIWSKPPTWSLSFPKKSDKITPYFETSELVVEDLEGDGQPDLLFAAGNIGMFPRIH